MQNKALGVVEMICPTCNVEGKTSRVTIGRGSVTLVYSAPFYDEQGKFHKHDTNTHTQEYTCSNGHRWTEQSKNECWCGWKAGGI